MRSEREIRTRLDLKNDLLKSYGYLSKVKNMHQQSLNELIDTDKPLRLLLFRLTFTDQFDELTEEEREKASYYIQELIALQLGQSFPESTTLQVEHNQVMTLIGGDASHEALMDVLGRLKAMADLDRELFLLTVAVYPHSCGPSELSSAYEVACRMLLERRFVGETQIVTSVSAPALDLLISPADDQELSIQLQAGERERALELLGKCMRRLEEKGASAHRFALFAREITAKIEKVLLFYQLDTKLFDERHSPFEQIGKCTEAGQLERLLARMIGELCMLVQEKKARHDPVKDFVLDYIVSHYREDLSLESVAEQLQMSRSYLSTYFRDKTGMTFTDYLNALRMSKAKELLGSGENILIGEVAAEVGYRNVNSFIRMFKKICGITPGEYRRASLQHMHGRGS
ncbi:helix-turn-helix transcriptional regulator [Paenibacillus hodogayensis]|uniref:Helix-turn-helix transcriptional regulator n=1 Tax=Paenibacillus hodogayensis TaxID=279208 RepID=A0ABV5W6Y7_9BACL